jgi:hypothetical protein
VEEVVSDWQAVAEWIASDLRMRPAPPQGVRNPFQRFAAQPGTADAGSPEGSTGPRTSSDGRRLDPSDLGLRLTATIVGDRVRMATINGKPYRENARITFPGEDASQDPGQISQEPALILKSVDRKFVLLERDGQLFRLHLAR